MDEEGRLEGLFSILFIGEGGWRGRGGLVGDGVLKIFGRCLLKESQRDVTLEARLELKLDIQVQTKLEAHRLGVGEAREDSRVSQTAAGELLVVAATAAAARVDGRGIRSGVIELGHEGVGSGHFV